MSLPCALLLYLDRVTNSVKWDSNVIVLFRGRVGENLNLSPDTITCVSMWVIQMAEGVLSHSAFP